MEADNPRRSWFTRFWRPTLAERKALLRCEAWVLVAASYAVILFAFLWPADFCNTAPTHTAIAWTAFIVRTFLFHLGLLLCVVAIAAAWWRQWRLCLAVVPLLAVTLGPSCWQYVPNSAPATVGETPRVMSVNLLMVNETTGPIIDEIKAARPEILLLQEYTDHWHDALQEAIGADYPHVVYVAREDSFGAAIYSRRPFVGDVEDYVPLGGGTEPQMRAVVEIAGRQVAIYNIHLLPPWGMEYVIESRMQFADLRDLLRDEPLPVIMGGDFNFTETSPQAAALGRIGLADSHSLAGWGRGTTWPVNSFFRWIPSIRLDHIYVGGGLTCTASRTGVGQGSDHRPVVAEVAFSQ